MGFLSVRANYTGYFNSADTEFQAWADLADSKQSDGVCYFSLIHPT